MNENRQAKGSYDMNNKKTLVREKFTVSNNEVTGGAYMKIPQNIRLCNKLVCLLSVHANLNVEVSVI